MRTRYILSLRKQKAHTISQDRVTSGRGRLCPTLRPVHLFWSPLVEPCFNWIISGVVTSIPGQPSGWPRARTHKDTRREKGGTVLLFTTSSAMIGGGGAEERRNFRPKLTDETTTMMEQQEDRPVYGCGHSIVYHSRRLAFGQGNWSLAHRADKVPMNKRRNKLLTTPRVIGIALFVPMCRKHLHGDVLVLRH